MAHPSSFVPTYTAIRSVRAVRGEVLAGERRVPVDQERQLLEVDRTLVNCVLEQHSLQDDRRPRSPQRGAPAGNVDMILQQSGPQIDALKHMKGVSYITDINQPRDPGLNFLIMNTTGTMNQYFAWAGEFGAQVPVRSSTSEGPGTAVGRPRG